MPTFVAVDLGATSGRVVRVHVDAGTIALEPVHRFATKAIDGPGGARHWDVDALLADVGAGVAAAAQRGDVESVGVDAWGVDYGLLDSSGRLLTPVHSYRSSRTDGVLDEVVGRIGRERIFRHHRQPVPPDQHAVPTRVGARVGGVRARPSDC